MKLTIDRDAPWYHGSNLEFEVLREGSTITQWRALAQAFAQKPTMLCIEDDGSIWHNGTELGILYIIDEFVEVGADIFPHPRTTMEENVEFLTKRPLRVKKVNP